MPALAPLERAGASTPASGRRWRAPAGAAGRRNSRRHRASAASPRPASRRRRRCDSGPSRPRARLFGPIGPRRRAGRATPPAAAPWRLPAQAPCDAGPRPAPGSPLNHCPARPGR
uniref:Uncharacterized protein n=1 Tax=Parastrongyloides trichosuri TaxID=131310 RepID=A0A0N5A112_PARTI